MTGEAGSSDTGQAQIPIQTLPKTALQAIYHAVTGKTENYSKSLRGNVIVKKVDIDNLFERLCQQLELHSLEFPPTVTIKVKDCKNKVLTYSSWERFRGFNVNSGEVTSEYMMQIEVVIVLPNTGIQQRLVVAIDIDSGLPMVRKGPGSFDLGMPPELILFFIRDWRTVNISIDFVDFLVAKSFSGVVEEWFGTLEKIPTKPFSEFLASKVQIISNIAYQSGNIGLAVFLASYAFFSIGSNIETVELIYAVAIAIIVRSLFQIVGSSVARLATRKIAQNAFPSVILLTSADENCLQELQKNTVHPAVILLKFAGWIVLTVLVNIASTYIYAKFITAT